MSRRPSTSILVLDVSGSMSGQRLMRDPDRFVSMLLLTDGENNAGLSFDRFRARWQGQKPARVFPISVGEANVASSDAQALLANGRFLEAKFRSVDFLAA